MASDEENAERFEEALGELLAAVDQTLACEPHIGSCGSDDPLRAAYDNLVSVMAAMREES